VSIRSLIPSVLRTDESFTPATRRSKCYDGLRPLSTFSLVLSLLCLLAVSACGGDSPEEPSSATPGPTIPVREPTELELPIRVVVTLPLFEDFVRAAGKENVEVVSVIPSGVSPHDYDPALDSLPELSRPRFFFYNGLELDSRVTETVEESVDDETFVVPFAPNIRSPRGSELGNPDLTADLAGDNAHLWLDPVLAYLYVEVIADEFTIYDGIRQGLYDDNFAAFREEMVQLREEVTAEIDKIPQNRRKLVTYHSSFEHFGRRFGLEISGAAVTQPGAAPDAGTIDALVAKIQTEEIPAVFAENGYDRGLMEQIASRAGVDLCTLYSDILPDGVDTYLEMMRRNVAEMVRCLGD
jgi:ABC-type Zn uptake system ZnuABC Zn-binding protein ZnuA